MAILSPKKRSLSNQIIPTAFCSDFCRAEKDAVSLFNSDAGLFLDVMPKTSRTSGLSLLKIAGISTIKMAAVNSRS